MSVQVHADKALRMIRVEWGSSGVISGERVQCTWVIGIKKGPAMGRGEDKGRDELEMWGKERQDLPKQKDRGWE